MVDPTKLSILLVEAERGTLAMVKEGLEPDGFLVVDIPTAKEAIGTCQAVQFDLLIIDPLVPHTRRLIDRMARWNDSLRVLFVSAYSQGTLFSTGLCPHGAEILRKPFTRREINGRVRSALALGRTWKNLARSRPPAPEAVDEDVGQGGASSLGFSESA